MRRRRRRYTDQGKGMAKAKGKLPSNVYEIKGRLVPTLAMGTVGPHMHLVQQSRVVLLRQVRRLAGHSSKYHARVIEREQA